MGMDYKHKKLIIYSQRYTIVHIWAYREYVNEEKYK